MSREIKIIRSNVEFKGFTVGQYQKTGTKTVRLHQVITVDTEYTSSAAENSLQQNPFADRIPETVNQAYTSESNRTVFLSVGQQLTEEEVINQITDSWCIKRIWSNSPILDDGQEYMINQGNITLDEIAEKQLVINPNDGTPILHNNRYQYKRDVLSLSIEDDEDNRGMGEEYIPKSFLVSEESSTNVGIVPPTLI